MNMHQNYDHPVACAGYHLPLGWVIGKQFNQTRETIELEEQILGNQNDLIFFEVIND